MMKRDRIFPTSLALQMRSHPPLPYMRRDRIFHGTGRIFSILIV
ncbi:hypothetical protein [Trichocoleus sp. FACHB-90]|nr:hypothetical protein [Trichocoleus sp. FACHB-90]